MYDTLKEKQVDDQLLADNRDAPTSLARLEKHILNYYISNGYVVGVGGWGFHIQINSEWKSKHIAVYFYDNCIPRLVTDEQEYETLEDAFEKVYETFKI